MYCIVGPAACSLAAEPRQLPSLRGVHAPQTGLLVTTLTTTETSDVFDITVKSDSKTLESLAMALLSIRGGSGLGYGRSGSVHRQWR